MHYFFAVPTVVADCTRFVENYGVVDGIYRVSGGSSQIRHLKYEFDSDRRPDLENHLLDIPSVANVPGMAKDNSRRCDAHSVAGLCKLYFRYVFVVIADMFFNKETPRYLVMTKQVH